MAESRPVHGLTEPGTSYGPVLVPVVRGPWGGSPGGPAPGRAVVRRAAGRQAALAVTSTEAPRPDACPLRMCSRCAAPGPAGAGPLSGNPSHRCAGVFVAPWRVLPLLPRTRDHQHRFTRSPRQPYTTCIGMALTSRWRRPHGETPGPQL